MYDNGRLSWRRPSNSGTMVLIPLGHCVDWVFIPYLIAWIFPQGFFLPWITVVRQVNISLLLLLLLDYGTVFLSKPGTPTVSQPTNGLSRLIFSAGWRSFCTVLFSFFLQRPVSFGNFALYNTVIVVTLLLMFYVYILKSNKNTKTFRQLFFTPKTAGPVCTRMRMGTSSIGVIVRAWSHVHASLTSSHTTTFTRGIICLEVIPDGLGLRGVALMTSGRWR